MCDLFPHVELVRNALSALRTQTHKLAQSIIEDNDFVFFNEKGIPIFDNQLARHAICDRILQWEFPKDLDNPLLDSQPSDDKAGDAPQQPDVYCAAISPATIEHVIRLNELKGEWAKLHGKLRKLFGGGVDRSSLYGKVEGEAQATKLMRDLLKLCGWGHIDLNATDRLIPLLDGPAVKMTWYKTRSAPSVKSTLGVVLESLTKLAEADADSRRDAARAELAKLDFMPHDTPVAFRAKAHRETIHYRAIVEVNNVRTPATQGYAMNPILFPRGGAKPELIVFESRRRGGGGRKASISKERVSYLVPHFYWYSRDETKPVTPITAKTHNPYARTRYPGLWLATRERTSGLMPFVMVKNEGKAATSVSIKRLGLSGAWRKAAGIYCDDRRAHLDEVIDSQPSMEQVTAMLAWANEQASHIGEVD